MVYGVRLWPPVDFTRERSRVMVMDLMVMVRGVSPSLLRVKQKKKERVSVLVERKEKWRKIYSLGYFRFPWFGGGCTLNDPIV